MVNKMDSHKVMLQVTESDTDLIGWLSLIGFLTMYWSPVERSIDQCVHLIYTQFDGKTILGKKPKHLDMKLKFIMDGYNKIPALGNNQKNISELISITKPVSEKRHIFVHGVIEEWSNNQITISKIKHDEQHLKEMFTVDILKIQSLVSNLSGLAKRWNAIASTLTNPSSGTGESALR
jgi:hypothetical protein